MVVNDFPNQEDRNRSIFNLRAARELKKLIDLKVVVPRTWLPGRKFLQNSEFEGIPVITIFAPQMPGWTKTNLIVYHCTVWNLIRPYLQSAHIVHSIGVDFAGLLCGMWARKTNIRHVTQFIADVNCLKYDFKSYPFFKNLKNHLHAIACNSQALAKTAQALFPNVAHIKTIYRGVDLNTFTSDGSLKGPLQNCSPVRFLFLGGLPMYSDRLYKTNTKGGETLMDAWKEAEHDQNFLNAHLLFAGPGADNHKVMQWRAGLKHPERVFVSGVIPPEDVSSYIRTSDVVLIPSMEEGLPNLALEAAACARPVFGSNIDCIAEIIVNGETGLVIPAGKVDDWKKILIDYSHPDKIRQLKQMGMQARKRMEKYFDYRNYSDQVVDLYYEALKVPLKNLY